MRTHNICLYKKVNKKYTGCNLKTMEFHECALIGVCAVIRSNTVYDRLPDLLFGNKTTVLKMYAHENKIILH